MTRKETLEHAKAIVDRIFHKKEEELVFFKGWVSRDKTDMLFLYGERPVKRKAGYWVSRSMIDIGLNENAFPKVKWEDEEPTEAEITIKIHKK